jgi:coenzyme F420-reducing hydrogenase alpha subunit
VDEYEMNKHIQFVIYTTTHIIRYKISLSDKKDNTTEALWEQTITALNDEGNNYVDNFSINNYQAMIERLERMINYYLETGRMLKEKKEEI